MPWLSEICHIYDTLKQRKKGCCWVGQAGVGGGGWGGGRESFEGDIFEGNTSYRGDGVRVSTISIITLTSNRNVTKASTTARN